LQRQQRKLAAKGIAVDIATLRREWEAKREMASTSAGTSAVASVSPDDSVTTASPGSQHRQGNNDDDDDDTDIDVEDDSTMDKNICHESESRCHDLNVTSDEESNYNNINCLSATMKTNVQDSLATHQGYDLINSYSGDSKRMSQEQISSEDTISPPCRTPKPSAARKSNPFSIESLLSRAEEYTD
jgi:hypothetical protein